MTPFDYYDEQLHASHAIARIFKNNELTGYYRYPQWAEVRGEQEKNAIKALDKFNMWWKGENAVDFHGDKDEAHG